MANFITYSTPSQFNSYEDCPRKWYATYILKKIPYIETPENQLGNIFHKIMEFCTLAQMKGLDPKLTVPANYIRAVTRNKITSCPKGSNGLPSNHLLTEESMALLPILCENVQSYGWKDNCVQGVTHIEHPIEFRIGGAKISGRVDRIDIMENHVRIIDFKSGKPYFEDKIAKDWQPKLYAYPYLKKGMIANFEFWFVRNSDGKKKLSFHPEQVPEIEAGIVNILERMKNESGTEWRTSGLCKYCGYYDTCIKMRV